MEELIAALRTAEPAVRYFANGHAKSLAAEIQQTLGGLPPKKDRRLERELTMLGRRAQQFLQNQATQDAREASWRLFKLLNPKKKGHPA